MNREQLEIEYRKYINEMAQEHLHGKPVNEMLLKVVASIQSKMRDMDILEAIEVIKEKDNSNTHQL